MNDALATPTTLTHYVQRLRHLKDYKEELEDKLKEINKEAADIQTRVLPAMMEEAEIERLKVENAGTVYVKQELYVSATRDEDGGEPPFYEWARQHAPDLIVDYIHPQRLKAWAKEKLEKGEPIPDNTLKATFVPTATLLRR